MWLFKKMRESGVPEWGIVALIVGIGFIIGMTASLAFGASGDVGLTWTAPTTNEDGTPLTDLGGYILFYGPTAGAYTASVDVGSVTTYTWATGPKDGGNLFFNIKAYDEAGNRSVFNGEVNVPFGMVAPNPPTNLQGAAAP